MTSKKIVLDTLEFQRPTRAPRQLWWLPWCDIYLPGAVDAIRREFPEDIIGSPGFSCERGIASGDMYAPGEATDDWGCVFENRQAGVIGEVKRPIITGENWEDADNAHFPTEWLTIDREKINDFCKHNKDKFIVSGCCPRPFEQLQFLRGTERLYMDLMDEPEGMTRFIAKMHALYCEQMELWAKTDVDALTFMDDWGAQQTLLIPPRVWRAIFKPLYKDYIDIAHRNGKKAFMHSDGHTLAIYPDLIELGLDAFNSQIFCMGLQNLEQYAGKITFWGEIDRQHLLTSERADDVTEAVTEVKARLWKDGGCIAQCEFGAGARVENVRRVYETWNRLTEAK